MSQLPELFAMQLTGFVPGAKLDVAKGSFRGIGFGGRATVAKFDAHTLVLDIRVTKLLFHIDVKLQFHHDAEGRPLFFGGRPDGKKTGNEPAHVKHSMTVKSKTPEGSVFDLKIDEAGTIIRPVAVEKTRHDGVEAMRLTYDRYEMTLVPSRRR
jgi:hypothetical protein